jgi:hypothetical protein
MKTKTVNFKSSVNIKFDIENIDFLRRYLPTPSHADSLYGILSGFNNPSNRRSHIVIGPYGTGKSFLGTLLASIVSKNIDDQAFNFISQKFTSLDDKIYDELIKVRGINKRFLPVILNGYEGKFRHSIISSILKTLSKNGIDIIVPGVSSKILETVNNWEKNFPNTFEEFTKKLSKRYKNIESWEIEILSQNKGEIEWFKSIFPILTSGAEFLVELNENFIDQIKFIMEELNQIGVGLFIVYDEFGRYLQSLERNEINETMQDLQDLAEFTDHFTEDLHLLFITHKHLRHYFTFFDQEFRNEFQRIEKRFKLYYIDNDSATFIRIAESVVRDIRTEDPDDNYVLKIISNLRKFPLFQELNQVELENLVVKGTYPVHPVTLFILPYLSSQYGQNERTLFTFLESKESNSLYEHLQKNKECYLPHQLFRYFFPNFFDVDFDEKDKIASIYKKLIKKIPELLNDNNSILLKILQFITLWELCGLQSKIKLSTEFIAFAFHSNASQIEEKLRVLETLKSVRFNRILGYWELFEGSAYNIDELVEDKLSKIFITKDKKKDILEESFSRKYFLSRKYNDDKSMTRFASINLVFSSEVINETFNPYQIRKKKGSDSVINFVILESLNDFETVKNKIIKYNDISSLYCINKYIFDEIDSSVVRQYALRQLLNDEGITKSDINLKKELQIHLEDSAFEIKKYIDTFLSFSESLTWIVKNKEEYIKNEIVLEEKLSEIMYELYPLTPEIRNDSYNRRKVNNVQLKAGYKVVESIIESPYKENLGIEGNGPEYLIYATVFKNNNLSIKKLDQLKSVEFAELRKALVKELDKNPSGNFSNLVNILSNKPFGIRKPLIPILLVALLRDKWDQIMFYKNEMYISHINGEIIFSMVEDPESYQYACLVLSDGFNHFIEFLEEEFKDFIELDNKKLMKPILVTSAMLKWLRNLPRYVQITNSLDEELLNLKDLIRMSEIDPQKGLKSLFKYFNDHRMKLKECISKLSKLYDSIKIEIEEEVYNKIGVNGLEDLQKWLDNQKPSILKENNLLKAIKTHIIESDWIEKVTFDLVGVELANWSDKTREMFLVQVENELNKIRNNAQSTKDTVEIHMNNTTKIIRRSVLSTKAKTLHQNVTRILKNGGRNVPKEEIENIVLLLLDEFVE